MGTTSSGLTNAMPSARRPSPRVEPPTTNSKPRSFRPPYDPIEPTKPTWLIRAWLHSLEQPEMATRKSFGSSPSPEALARKASTSRHIFLVFTYADVHWSAPGHATTLGRESNPWVRSPRRPRLSTTVSTSDSLTNGISNSWRGVARISPRPNRSAMAANSFAAAAGRSPAEIAKRTRTKPGCF